MRFAKLSTALVTGEGASVGLTIESAPRTPSLVMNPLFDTASERELWRGCKSVSIVRAPGGVPDTLAPSPVEVAAVSPVSMPFAWGRSADDVIEDAS